MTYEELDKTLSNYIYQANKCFSNLDRFRVDITDEGIVVDERLARKIGFVVYETTGEKAKLIFREFEIVKFPYDEDSSLKILEYKFLSKILGIGLNEMAKVDPLV